MKAWLQGAALLLAVAYLCSGEETNKPQVRIVGAAEILKMDGVLVLSDGSSHYVFKANGQFASGPHAMSGRCFDGTWKKIGDAPLQIEAIAKFSWMNGTQPNPDKYYRIVFTIYNGGKRPFRKFELGPSDQKEVFEGYWLIDELVRIPKPEKF